MENDNDDGPQSPDVELDSDDGLELNDDDKGNINSIKKKAVISDDEESEKGSVVGGLIADIFGSSDEDEEFEGFGEGDLSTLADKDKKKSGAKENENQSQKGDSDNESQKQGGFVCEFDMMLEQRKAEMRSRRRKRKDVDIINDSDDVIEEMLKNMKEAIDADRMLNEEHKPTFKVLKLLPYVKHQLRKIDLHQAFLDAGVLTAITDWLAPLPSKALPHLEIREALLKQLLEFPLISTEGLKMSGLGKAVMYLYKHPKETKSNKEMANKLITEWARPVFNQNSDYKNLTREEREQRDYEQLPKKRRISLDNNNSEAKEMEKVLQDEKCLRPGDPGYIYRARVPAPSNKDYVIRPKWSSDERQRPATNKKALNKIQKYERQMLERKKALKIQSAVTISIEGRKMAL